MKKFILKLVVFCLIPIVYFGTVHLINLYIYSNQKVILENKRVIIMGDSHPAKSLDPSLFSSAQNISQNAESYIVTYWKLKKVIEDNKIDTILLGFAPHNISAFNDLKFSNKKWSHTIFKRSYPIGDFKSIDDKINIDYHAYLKTIWKETCMYPKRNHIHFMSKFKELKSSNPSNWDTAIKRHYYLNDVKLDMSEVAVNFLDSIINICELNRINLILVNSPVHVEYLNNIPNQILLDYDSLSIKYMNMGIKVIDKKEEIYSDSLFLDSDHLNFYGAQKFTKDIIGILGNQDTESKD